MQVSSSIASSSSIDPSWAEAHQKVREYVQELPLDRLRALGDCFQRGSQGKAPPEFFAITEMTPQLTSDAQALEDASTFSEGWMHSVECLVQSELAHAQHSPIPNRIAAELQSLLEQEGLSSKGIQRMRALESRWGKQLDEDVARQLRDRIDSAMLDCTLRGALLH